MPPLATAFTALTVSSHSGCGRWPFEVKLNGLIWLRTSRKQFHIMGMKDLSVRNEGIRDTREELIEDAVIGTAVLPKSRFWPPLARHIS